jgi:hypothetical protein
VTMPRRRLHGLPYVCDIVHCERSFATLHGLQSHTGIVHKHILKRRRRDSPCGDDNTIFGTIGDGDSEVKLEIPEHEVHKDHNHSSKTDSSCDGGRLGDSKSLKRLEYRSGIVSDACRSVSPVIAGTGTVRQVISGGDVSAESVAQDDASKVCDLDSTRSTTNVI